MRNLLKNLVTVSVFVMLLQLSSCKDEPVIAKPETSIVIVSEIDKTSINFSFALVNNGGELNEIGICWDTENYPTISKNKLVLSAGATSFSQVLEGLTPGTKYYIRSYAINSAGTGYSETQSFTTLYSYYEGTIKDVENNEYDIIKIGNQTWMAENLKTTKLNDNTPISQISSNTDWAETNEPAYCWYANNQSDNAEIHGALYNFNAVSTEKLCPQGYHVPTEQDWQNLENYLISNGYNYDGTTTGDKIAKSIASKETWQNSVNVGTVGNDQETNNATGFNAYPSGVRNYSGNYLLQTYSAQFWTSTDINASIAYSIDIFNTTEAVYINENSHSSGYSIRCVKD